MTVRLGPAVAVMVPVPDPAAALDWYARAFGTGEIHHLPAFDIGWLQVGATQVEPVRADTKLGTGPTGTVVYWEVADVDRAWRHLLSLGARPYRGPMAIEDGRWMGQVLDPWGNAFGVRGPSARTPGRRDDEDTR